MFTPLINLLAAASPCAEKSFFGLVPWYHYLEKKVVEVTVNGEKVKECKINFNILPSGSQADAPLVLAAIVDDLLRIAGFVAVAFVIVGAIQYVTSEGNPENTAKAQSTILNALIGLAIAIVGVAFVSFVGNKLGG
jgi:hypothetical protein